MFLSRRLLCILTVGGLAAAGAAMVRMQVAESRARSRTASLAPDFALQQAQAAEADFRDALASSPAQPKAWHGLADALYRQQRYLEAAEAAQRAVSLRADDVDSRYLLANSLLEYTLQFPDSKSHRAELRQAREHFKKLAALWPERADIHYRLGLACAGLGIGDEAVSHLRRATQLAPERPDAWRQLVRELMDGRDRKTARDVVDQALARHRQDAFLHDLRSQLLQTDPGEEALRLAIEASREAVRLKPEQPQFLEHLGMALTRAKRFQEARDAFEAEVRLNPHRPFPHRQLAGIYTQLGDAAAATREAKLASRAEFAQEEIKHIQDLIRRSPDDVSLYLALARRYSELGMKAPEREAYLRVLQREPQNQVAQVGLAALGQGGTSSEPLSDAESGAE